MPKQARQPKRRRRTVLEPIGEVRRFEMPFRAVPGRLVNPELGLRSISLRAGDNAPYAIDVTVLDAPDHRLMRAGVWLAHRILDGRGEWYLAAEQWAPWLPAERIEAMGHADLPDVFADLIRPFRRAAALGPVAALTCEREEFALRGAAAELIAVFRDDQVQIRTGGVVTTSYREVTLTGVEGRLTGAQLAWLTEVLSAVGGIRVEEFPTLAQRIGAPATGLSDFPAPRECRPGDSLDNVWSHRLGRRMRPLTYADLAVRAASPGAKEELAQQLGDLRAQFKGFIPLLDTGWAEGIVTEIDWMLGQLASDEPAAAGGALQGQRYLRLLDRLVSAARAPAFGDQAGQPAGVALAGQLQQRLADFTAAAEGLDHDSPDDAWREVHTAAASLRDTCAVQIRPGPDVDQLSRRTARFLDQLDECLRTSEAYAALDVGALTSVAAFEAGRRFERAYAEQASARTAFVAQWARRGRKIRTWTLAGEPAPPTSSPGKDGSGGRRTKKPKVKR